MPDLPVSGSAIAAARRCRVYCPEQMSKSLLAAMLASAAFLAADNAALTGKWQVHTSIADHENDQVCSFTQTGNELSGDCSSEGGALKVTGKVADKTVTWMYKSEYEGNPLTVTYKGAWDGAGKISGTVSVEEYGAEGEFTAALSK